jgi:hypothetical protein
VQRETLCAQLIEHRDHLRPGKEGYRDQVVPLIPRRRTDRSAPALP